MKFKQCQVLRLRAFLSCVLRAFCGVVGSVTGNMPLAKRGAKDTSNLTPDPKGEKVQQDGAHDVSGLMALDSSGSEKVRSPRIQHKYETIQVATEDNITTITLNRPDKKNAINMTMVRELIQALEEAGRDDSSITVLTGSGDYFSSGNDLAFLLTIVAGEPEEQMEFSKESIKFISAFVDFPKPLIAMVNGPAIGISVTILGLFDVVYASEKATFQTPFSKFGVSPEGCSSFTFPAIMGPSKATEMLLFSKLLTARDACALGLVADVFPDKTFHSDVWKRLKDYALRPKETLALSKQLIRGIWKDKLHEVIAQESECFIRTLATGGSLKVMERFLQKRSKL
ncbi:enoyl-CoA delta isomerase 2-like [Lissotriton helveticus]